MHARPRLSLKARAIALLAQREHSRNELRRKLLNRAKEDARRDAEDGIPGVPGADQELIDPAPAVDELLDWLEAHDYLSADRFIESRVTARSARFGSQRIRHELSQHGVTLQPDTLNALKASEFDRARAIWSRKFGSPAVDAAGRAKQARFLAARGFPGEVIRRVVSGLSDD